jgi:hypothetical protein
MDKLTFLRIDFPKRCKKLQYNVKGEWGMLNGQQMVEHMSDSIRMATGKEELKVLTPDKHLDKAKKFGLSDKPFRENTPNSTMPIVPKPVKNVNMDEAIAVYKVEMDDFISFFENNSDRVLPNPFFGFLNFNEWVHLLHKHATHHAKQFNLL